MRPLRRAPSSAPSPRRRGCPWRPTATASCRCATSSSGNRAIRVSAPSSTAGSTCSPASASARSSPRRPRSTHRCSAATASSRSPRQASASRAASSSASRKAVGCTFSPAPRRERSSWPTPARYVDADLADGGKCLVSRVDYRRDVAGRAGDGGARRRHAAAVRGGVRAVAVSPASRSLRRGERTPPANLVAANAANRGAWRSRTTTNATNAADAPADQ